ncbi:hypothetical protein ACE1CA_00120 [Aerosakkonemataceae cyanobacterium BLCC-F167]|uniref:Uncharacterized protein n=1 Tax=Floridaenema evergladense BLCC-F167 TaxID=3153639 RepID=A0ABV4WCV8_9CYAN
MHCKHLNLSPTVSGWICFDCFQRFSLDTFPDWENKRIKLLENLKNGYQKTFEKRPKEAKRFNETIAEIDEELCQLNNLRKPLKQTVA